MELLFEVEGEESVVGGFEGGCDSFWVLLLIYVWSWVAVCGWGCWWGEGRKESALEDLSAVIPDCVEFGVELEELGGEVERLGGVVIC